MLKLFAFAAPGIFWLGGLSVHQAYMDRELVYMRGQIDAMSKVGEQLAGLTQSHNGLVNRLEQMEERLLHNFGIGDDRPPFRVRP